MWDSRPGCLAWAKPGARPGSFPRPCKPLRSTTRGLFLFQQTLKVRNSLLDGFQFGGRPWGSPPFRIASFKGSGCPLNASDPFFWIRFSQS